MAQQDCYLGGNYGSNVSGIVDYPTWYKIQSIYVAVTRIAELQ